jgi:hypothetical protein
MEKGHTISPLSESRVIKIDDQKRKRRGKPQLTPSAVQDISL